MEQTVKRDVYTIVTDRIIEKLEQGVVPWRQPWQDAGLPQNLITRRPYRGINVMLLGSLGYEKNFFLTAKQLSELNASQRPEEKPHLVVFWNWVEPKDTDGNDGDQKKRPFLRYYNVFNVVQCDGIPADMIPPVTRPLQPIPACEKVVNGMPRRPELVHDGHRAFYDPATDTVQMPFVGSFQSDEGYYATLFHELVHSTGHPKRLDRKGFREMAEFGSDTYSFEELVAEIGACYLESFTGIASARFEQNVAYLKGWLKKFRSDKKFIVQAGALAQKATDFILNVNHSEYE